MFKELTAFFLNIENFKNHPFKVKDIVSGHRRKRAVELANIGEIPCIVRELTDDEIKYLWAQQL